MQKIKVAVIFGGMSTEHEISKVSASTVITNLPSEKYFVMPVYITKAGKWLLYDGIVENTANIQWEKHGTPVVLSPDATHKGLIRIVGDKAKHLPVDIVFPVMHGKTGEDGCIQGLCELAGLPYVGAGVLASAGCMDKAFTKVIVKSLGIAQAEHLVVMRSDLEERLDEVVKKVRYKLGYPCFIKPANTGSSVGISKAGNKAELEKALFTAAEFDKKIIVEKAIVGRELECAVLGNENPEASGVGEIVTAAEFYTYDAKYNDSSSQTIVSPDLPEEIAEEIRSNSIAIYKAMGCAGMARVDFFYDTEKDRVVFNEINTIPGFTGISMYAMLWGAVGADNAKLLDSLIELGLKRYE